MAFIEWQDEEFSVGIVAMDDEHKVLIGLINALSQNKNSPKHEMLERIFTTLDFYVKNHFTHEERLMEQMKYPKLELHQKLHRIFIKNLKNMKATFERGNYSTEFIELVLDFLKDWLSKHIMVEDREYGQFLIK